MNEELDFDLIDDLIHFINNNTEFYKSVYYPVVQKFHNNHKYNLPLDKSVFVPVVKQAYDVYKKAYNLDNLPAQLDMQDLSDICTKLYQQEEGEIKKQESPEQHNSGSTELESIKRLAGISGPYTEYSLSEETNKAAARVAYAEQNEIQPGSNEWFAVWFKNDGLNMPSGFRGRK